MKITGKYHIALICSLLFAAYGARAQEAVAVSSDPGTGLHIALNWTPVKDATKYAIYRRLETTPNYLASALNTTPIQALTSCAAIKTLLIKPPDSTDWNLVAYGLAENNTRFNPCLISTIPFGSEKHNRLQALARVSMPIAIAAVWG